MSTALPEEVDQALGMVDQRIAEVESALGPLLDAPDAVLAQASDQQRAELQLLMAYALNSLFFGGSGFACARGDDGGTMWGGRWCGCVCVCVCAPYAVRWCVSALYAHAVACALAADSLSIAVAFITPKDEDDALEGDGQLLPMEGDDPDAFRPFVRRMPERDFWWAPPGAALRGSTRRAHSSAGPEAEWGRAHVHVLFIYANKSTPSHTITPYTPAHAIALH